MKSSAKLLLVLICTVVFNHCQAKKGCNAYGMACYGGHGKRAIIDNDRPAVMMTFEQNPLQNAMRLRENSADEYESNQISNRLDRIISWLNANHRNFPVVQYSNMGHPELTDAAPNRGLQVKDSSEKYREH